MSRADDTRFDSWKEIAAYFGRDLRTVRRWEEERGLPVHRVPGGRRPAVYAYRSEIDAWLRSANVLEPGEATRERGRQGSEPRDLDRDLHEPATAQTQGIHAAPPTGQPAPVHPESPRRSIISRRLALGLAGLGLVVGAAYVLLNFKGIRGTREHGALAAEQRETRIDSVTPVRAQTVQTIMIEGHGFGPRPRTILNNPQEGGVDTYGGNYQTSLAISNLGQGAHRWIAGRASEVNRCEIGVKLERWENNRIVLSGFAGPLGTKCNNRFQIAAGDRLQFAVYGSFNRCGPGGPDVCPQEIKERRVATFETVVLPSLLAGRNPSCR